MIRIVALTQSGHKLANDLQRRLAGSEVWFKPQPFRQRVQQAFLRAEKLIFICATGIVVRTLAPVLKNKHTDPPVLVLDEAGRYVIPLLCGHQGGANHWAGEIAVLLGARAVITTARPYLEPVYTVGMGCDRQCPQEHLQRLLEVSLQQAGLGLAAISSINSIDIKNHEAGLIALAKQVEMPFRTWSAQQLNSVEDLLSTKSEYVYKTVGVYGVAEAAALYAAQEKTGSPPELVLSKQKSARATCSIARAYPAPAFLHTEAPDNNALKGKN